MKKHLIKADILNDQKIAKALESVNKIEERIHQTELKKNVVILLFSNCMKSSKDKSKIMSLKDN